MQYTLYIGKNCHQCQDVVEFMNINRIDYRKVHVHKSGENPPIEIYIFPALFVEDQLMAYGTDIVKYFEKKLEKPKSVGLMGKIRVMLSRIIG